MDVRNFISWATCLLVILIVGSEAVNNNATSTNITLTTSTGQGGSTTSTSKAPPSTTVPSSQSKKNSTSLEEEEDCEDDDPKAEPEGTDRQGKQIHLGNDKDHYMHEDGKAEPESEPGANSTSAAGKLTGNATTTARPSTGSASSFGGAFYTCGLGLVLAFSVSMKI